MSARHLFVAGFGRCGTTLIMTMLDAGGFPVAGPRPSYELPGCWSIAGPDRDWLNDQAGRAVKWIIPSPDRMEGVLRRDRPVVLLLTRDLRQQARSQVKLLDSMVPLPIRHQAVKGMERSLRADLPVLRARLRARAEVTELFFEMVVQDGFAAAQVLDDLLRREFGFQGFDMAAAARVVMRRHPDCLPDLRMETTILPMVAEWIERRQAA